MNAETAGVYAVLIASLLFLTLALFLGVAG